MQLLRSLKSFVLQPRTLLVLYMLFAIVTAIQLLSLGYHPFVMPPAASYAGNPMFTPQQLNSFIGQRHTDYNNYVIFRSAYFHLVQGKNLYALYPAEQWDYYKYSPVFALIMGVFAYLPDMIGLALWNILNAAAVYMAIRMLPFKVKTQCLLLLFVAMELLTSIQNAQSNGLMCGLMIATYACMQRGKLLWATLWLVVATYIKIYGAIGCCLFLLYPGKLRFILYALFWTILFTFLPLLVTSWHTLLWQYQQWGLLLKADAMDSFGISVAGWLHSWFGIKGKFYVTLVGILLFLLPFIRTKLYGDQVYRLLILAAMLIWVIIFNHKAESPTYVIAVAGVGIWYFAQEPTPWRTALLWLTFVFTSLATTDVFPPYVRLHFMLPYTIKAVPCILTWCIVTVTLLRLKPAEQLQSAKRSATDCLTQYKPIQPSL